MSFLNVVTPQHIEALNQYQLVDLLLRLLKLEAIKCGLPLSQINVPFNITAPDGGEDGRFKWEEANSDWVQNRDWIPNKYTIFQCKATSLTAQECANEILNSDKDDLKPRVRDVFEARGAYILFCSHIYNEQSKNERIQAIRNSLEALNFPNFQDLKIDFYDAGKIATWTNCFFQTVNFIYECGQGFSLPVGFKTWGALNQYIDFQNEFFSNDTLDSYINLIKEQASSRKNITRILGLAGLGKTRLITEAFKKMESTETPENLRQNIISDSMIYYDAGSHKDFISDFVIDMINNKMIGTLIIDNCSVDIHYKLVKEIKRLDSELNLITIDYFQSLMDDETNYIELKNSYYESVITNILNANFPNISSSDKERIKSFVQGFPLLAVKLAKQLSTGANNIGAITDEVLIKKIIWGNNHPDADELLVLKACSIFDKLGFIDELISQRQFIANNNSLCPLNYEGEIRVRKFFEICNKFISNGILEKRGRYIILRPKPLAISLAAEWWKNFPPENFAALLPLLVENNLSQPLCEQLSYLNFLVQAKELVKDLCKENAPFGQAEVLNTKEGSQLFRFLAIVNPQIASETLYRIFIPWTKDELINIKEGRRELIWTLELLCWRNETFVKAVKVLLSFAVSENEKWSNNATGIFTHLFHVNLPGTEASLYTRLDILKYALNKSSEYRSVAFEALKKALVTHYFTRSSGFEMQGSGKTLKDYNPALGELREYWKECIKILRDEIVNRGEFMLIADEILTSSIRGLCSLRFDEVILPTIKEISEIKGYVWMTALDDLKLTLKYEKKILDQYVIDEISELINQLSPKDFTNMYDVYINNPGWEEHIDDDGNYIDMGKINSEKLVMILMATENLWKEHINLFYTGKQIQGYNFGFALSQKFKQETINPKEFFDLSIKEIKKIHDTPIVLLVLIGFVNGLEDLNQNNYILDLIFNDSTLQKNVFYFASNIKITFEFFIKLIELIKEKGYEINLLSHFSYNDSFLSFTLEQIQNIITLIDSFEEQGAWTITNLMYRYLEVDPARLNSLKDSLRTVLSKNNFLIKNNKNSQLDEFYWENLVKGLLEKYDDENFAKNVMQQIVIFCKQSNYDYRLEISVKNILKILIKKYFDSTWPILGSALIENSIGYFHLSNIIGARIDFDDAYDEGFKTHSRENNGILFKENTDKIIKWCEDNKPIAPIRIAKIVPILNKENKNEWPTFTKLFIEKFGNDEKVLREISLNMGSYSWSGSVVPLLREEVELLKKFRDSENVTISDWATKNIEYLEKEIKRRKTEDEEMYL